MEFRLSWLVRCSLVHLQRSLFPNQRIISNFVYVSFQIHLSRSNEPSSQSRRISSSSSHSWFIFMDLHIKNNIVYMLIWYKQIGACYFHYMSGNFIHYPNIQVPNQPSLARRFSSLISKRVIGVQFPSGTSYFVTHYSWHSSFSLHFLSF